MSDEEEFEEIERIVLGLDEPDSDLYDRVAYLDMVKAHQLERKRKFRSMANLEVATATKFVFRTKLAPKKILELFCLGRGRGKAMALEKSKRRTAGGKEMAEGGKAILGKWSKWILEGNGGTGGRCWPKKTTFLRFRVGKAGEMNRRSVSFTEPPKVRRNHRRHHHHRHLQASTSEEETDVDLPRHSRGLSLAQHNKSSSSLSIDTQMPPSNFPAQISPVLDPSIYDELAFCDCSLFPECALGKAIPLLDLDERIRERKRATDLLDIIPEPPNPFSQKNQWAPSFEEMGRKTTMKRQKGVLEENGGSIGGSIGCFGRRGNALAADDQRYSNWNSNWNPPSPPPPPVPFLPPSSSSSLPPPPDHLSSSRSPSPPSSSNSSSSSADHFNNEGEKTILFRLPLTITRAKHGRNVGECEVRERRVDGRRGHAEPVDFTKMGLFVGPPSETDPEESFVLVERRKLFAESPESTSALPAASISPLATTTASPHHSQRQSQQHPSPSTANHHLQFHRGPSAENLLSIRVTESGQQQAPPLLREPDLDTDERREEEFGSGEEGVDIPSMPIGGGGGGIGRNRSPHFLEGPHPHHHHPHPHSHSSPLQPQSSSPSSSSMKAPAAGGGGAMDRREDLAGIVDPQIRHIWAEAVDLSEIRNVEDQTEFRSLRAQLGIDKISSETLSQYHVKGHMDNFDQPAICYPRYRGPSARNRIPNGIKLIRRIGDKLAKENYPHETDKIRFSGMFGLHMITQFDNRIVLCTNERDALAVYDASNGIPALSLPQGERFDPTVVPYLEDFDLIYIWFPHIHERFAKDYASYLNAARCYIITAPLRPVELVRDNRAKEVLHSIQDAVRVRYKGFRSVQDLRDSVRSEIVQSKSKLAGLTLWKRYSLLNNYLRGFRPCEMTVLSGGSHGKTTFICEYAMDLYTQGVRTLFCNFEMPEEKILKWMIIQFAGPSHVRSLARSRTFTSRSKVPLQQRQEHSSVEMWLDRFERTHSDLVIMKTEEFREKTLKEIADAIREQTLACGTQHLVIDNLQALVDMATVHIDPMTVAERTHQQDRFVGMLRRIASTQELHITLVVHPIKEPNELGYYELHHIGGPSAKITQEADNVLVIQRRRDADDRRKFRKFLYILKNRFGGRCVEVDQIEMLFQPSTLIHSLVETSR